MLRPQSTHSTWYVMMFCQIVPAVRYIDSAVMLKPNTLCQLTSNSLHKMNSSN